MFNMFYSCSVLFLCLSIITGGLYPLVVTLVAQSAFPDEANGCLIVEDGKVIGSSLIAQAFTKPEYFWSRPSAAGYNGGGSSGSNLGPTNPTLLESVSARAKDVGAKQSAPIPIDLVTASASGLDPHITPAAAYYQIPRVARARQIPEEKLAELIRENTEERTFGILGERRVNVLSLNRSLDAPKAVK